MYRKEMNLGLPHPNNCPKPKNHQPTKQKKTKIKTPKQQKNEEGISAPVPVI